MLQFIKEEQVKIEKRDLYEKIAQISYIGDIRMNYKVENPRKAKNIVEGSL